MSTNQYQLTLTRITTSSFTTTTSLVIDKDRKVVGERRMRNDLAEVFTFLEPYRDELEGVVVESTFNWYWLVDGLAEAGYQMHLANTWACKQYEGLKYTDDRHDARWLAHMLSLGILPEGFIYPMQERAVRDLLRRRAFLVHKRTSFLLSMRGALECRTGTRFPVNDLKKLTAEDIRLGVEDQTSALGIACLLEPISSIDAMIKVLEKEAAKKARLRDQFKPSATPAFGQPRGISNVAAAVRIDLVSASGGSPIALPALVPGLKKLGRRPNRPPSFPVEVEGYAALYETPQPYGRDSFSAHFPTSSRLAPNLRPSTVGYMAPIYRGNPNPESLLSLFSLNLFFLGFGLFLTFGVLRAGFALCLCIGLCFFRGKLLSQGVLGVNGPKTSI